MKSVIAFACLLAVASAGYINAPVVAPAVAYAAAYEDGAYRGEGLYESAYKGEGLIESQDLARVAVAPIAHAYAAPIAHAYAAPVVASGSHAVAYNAPLVSAPHPVHVAHTYAPYAYAAPYAHTYAHAYAAPAIGLASEARLVDPVAIAAGAPLPTGDTVEVAAAKAAHFQAHAAAKGHIYGAPVTTYAHHAYAHHGIGLASEARLVDPVAIAAGAPLPTGDTVEVAAAKAAHYAAHHDAKVGHLAAKGHFIAKRSPGYLSTAYAAPIHSYGYSSYASPLAYSAYNHYGYGRLGFY